MPEILAVKELKGAGATEDGINCRLDYVDLNDQPGALVFPLDQLDALVGLLLHVERKRSAESEEFPKQTMALLAQNVEVGSSNEDQMIMLDFHVDQRKFAFALSREDAINLVSIISTLIPKH